MQLMYALVMTRVLFLNDGSTSSNWGLQTASFGLKSNIENFRGNQKENLITGSVSNVDYGRIFSSRTLAPFASVLNRQLVSDRLGLASFYRLPQSSLDLDQFCELWDKQKGGRGAELLLRLAADTDVIVIQGEGGIHGNTIAAGLSAFFSYYAKTRLEKKVIITNSSYGLSHANLGLQSLLIKASEAGVVFTAREPVSQRALSGLLKRPVSLAPDSAFASTADHLDAGGILANQGESRRKRYWALSGTMLAGVFNTPGSQRWLEETIFQVSREVGLRPLFVHKDPEDRHIAKIVQRSGGHVPSSIPSLREFLELLSGAEFLISGRYHHLISAASLGIPVIPLETSSTKIQGLSELLDIQQNEQVVINPFHSAARRDLLRQVSHLKSKGFAQIGANLVDKSQALAEVFQQTTWDAFDEALS